MLSALTATAVLVSGFGWYQLANWHHILTQAQSEQTECPTIESKPGCGRRG